MVVRMTNFPYDIHLVRSPGTGGPGDFTAEWVIITG